jgi:4-hydroxy-tetrahydrodipicolinate reductase
MKMMLLGYGKMGKAVEEVAISRGHVITHRIGKGNLNFLDTIDKNEVDLVVEFSTPAQAYNNLEACIRSGFPVVCGTTGWLDRKKKIELFCKELGGAFFYSSNFSIGAHVFIKANQYISKLLSKYSYKISIEEIHHESKIDVPSGTAMALAKAILEACSNSDSSIQDYCIEKSQSYSLSKNSFMHKVVSISDESQKWNQISELSDYENELYIKSERKSDITGIHKVNYNNEDDYIQFIHTAQSRHGFALGAVLAAEWLKDKKGVFSMDDFLGL